MTVPSKSVLRGTTRSCRHHHRLDNRLLGAGFESLEARQVLAVTLAPIGGYETGIFDDGAAEGVSYSVAAERLFVANQ